MTSTNTSKMNTRCKKTAAGTFEENSKNQLTVKYIKDDDIKKVIIGVNLSQGSNIQVSTPKSNKRGIRTKKHVEEEEDESDNHSFIGTYEKPSGLCDEDDVAGDKMYSFRTPKKKQGMIQKAVESVTKNKTGSGTPKIITRKSFKPGSPVCDTPPKPKWNLQQNSSVTSRTPTRHTPKKIAKTPKKVQEETDILIPKTPYQLRVRQKRAIQAYRRTIEAYDNSEDSDYQSSDDSCSESEDSASESEKEDTSSDSGKGSEVALPHCRRSLRFQHPSTIPSSRKRGKDINYVFKADEYFQSQNSKCTTSDHNLSRLKTPRLESTALHNLLTQCSVSEKHQHILAKRREDDSIMFQQWMFALSQGFSVLAYGLGSKYKILQNFHREMLSDSHVLVVNGFFPSLNIKEVVEMIAKDLLGLSQVLLSPHAIIDWIESRSRMPRVFLIIHNLDAEMFRCDKSQRILSRLASLPKVHLVASVDHINCPLLWDQANLSGFNFMWEDTTSFLPYKEETSYETSLMVQNSGSLALSSLLNVYRSLTHNSRGVFRIILEKHLDDNSQKCTGMAFSALYSRCREEMLVTSDLALRTMLTEFLDHQMVKWRRDGENLYIPTDNSVLRQFRNIIQDS